MSKKIFLLISGVLFFNAALFSQEVANAADTTSSPDYLIWGLTAVSLLLTIVAVVLAFRVSNLMGQLNHGEKAVNQEGLFSKLLGQLNAAVPVEKEKEIEFAHAYDGIRELDNDLPPWWKYLFYITLVFSGVYLYRYHISKTAPLSIEEYDQEMAEASLQKESHLKETGNVVDESSVIALTDDAVLKKGKQTFTVYCMPCHGPEGQGNVGPNLTDEFWIHGGGIKNIFKTIKYGWPAKGMISWQSQLNPKQIQEVASYVMTLQGTNPPNPKAPQGDKYVPEASPL